MSASIKASLAAGDLVANIGNDSSLFPDLSQLNLIGVDKEDLGRLLNWLLPSRESGRRVTLDLSHCIFCEESVASIISSGVTDLSVQSDCSLLVKLLSEVRTRGIESKIERLFIHSDPTLLPEDIEALILSTKVGCRDGNCNDSHLSTLKTIRVTGCHHVHSITGPRLQRIANESSITSGSASIYVTIGGI